LVQFSIVGGVEMWEVDAKIITQNEIQFNENHQKQIQKRLKNIESFSKVLLDEMAKQSCNNSD